MKVPPKRKGNQPARDRGNTYSYALNESPSEKEGKFNPSPRRRPRKLALNESPSEKEGKLVMRTAVSVPPKEPSMKVPPKRKGNLHPRHPRC